MIPHIWMPSTTFRMVVSRCWTTTDTLAIDSSPFFTDALSLRFSSALGGASGPASESTVASTSSTTSSSAPLESPCSTHLALNALSRDMNSGCSGEARAYPDWPVDCKRPRVAPLTAAGGTSPLWSDCPGRVRCVTGADVMTGSGVARGGGPLSGFAIFTPDAARPRRGCNPDDTRPRGGSPPAAVPAAASSAPLPPDNRAIVAAVRAAESPSSPVSLRGAAAAPAASSFHMVRRFGLGADSVRPLIAAAPAASAGDVSSVPLSADSAPAPDLNDANGSAAAAAVAGGGAAFLTPPKPTKGSAAAAASSGASGASAITSSMSSVVGLENPGRPRFEPRRIALREPALRIDVARELRRFLIDAKGSKSRSTTSSASSVSSSNEFHRSRVLSRARAGASFGPWGTAKTACESLLMILISRLKSSSPSSVSIRLRKRSSDSSSNISSISRSESSLSSISRSSPTEM
mmetsp:Transcript_30906/g.92783  ORF Transcript_30906/g.92783 Transcript_30906/m.92783 type:complete len:463 (-) Transcript_30906:171-1559(-)